MKVYLGIEGYYNGCDDWKTVVKVFDDEVKALIWCDEFKATEREYREYREMEVE